MEVRDFCQQHPEFAKQSALEPFYFCESLEVTLPLGRTARTLDEFREGISPFSDSGFYFHFISSRLRLQLRTNDFSHWLARESMAAKELMPEPSRAAEPAKLV